MSTITSTVSPALKKVIDDARAQIMLGSSIADVWKWLSTCDLREEEVVLVVKHCFNQCMRDRGACVRKAGIKDVLLGALLFLVGIGCIVLWHAGYGISLLCAGFGCWRVAKGVGRIIEGAKIRGSIVET